MNEDLKWQQERLMNKHAEGELWICTAVTHSVEYRTPKQHCNSLTYSWFLEGLEWLIEAERNDKTQQQNPTLAHEA